MTDSGALRSVGFLAMARPCLPRAPIASFPLRLFALPRNRNSIRRGGSYPVLSPTFSQDSRLVRPVAPLLPLSLTS